MSNLIFPSYFPGINIEVVRRRMNSTIVQTMVNGQEARVGLWAYPRYEWEIDFAALHNYVSGLSGDLRDNEMQTLVSFCNQLSGSFDSFFFADTFTPDYTVSHQFIHNGDGITTTFPLYRTLGTSAEPIPAFNNVSGTPNYGWVQPAVYLNGALQLGSTWQVNPGTGGSGGSVVTNPVLFFPGGPIAVGTAITATFSYFWKCRLSDDAQEFAECWPQVWKSKSPIKFISIKQ